MTLEDFARAGIVEMGGQPTENADILPVFRDFAAGVLRAAAAMARERAAHSFHTGALGDFAAELERIAAEGTQP